ncbi:hypothetical protein BJI69_11540 [Luteibacter rhizovicinus DSM 16549]|uniref:DUF4097 domain-containing protein n=1 Tax=Luteibacter rhizovicinus DSM 16549 TaxID=1440763 RepID=A0A0G9HD60_9GAMM|nr:DUF4097 family beta strand repeat-containing protein [Luteibacter rhizovicinus]APG04468.1 hypothetical protein BJI69_11540 [Luteibacter rhizovicinus DSM 16549]KLD67660.1 hypothetical protein Y883_06905 [Luteibacter rhizovicinus DSM 16549]KLD79915.1 hypothetical protein Y886_01860 [Xanthomonas hyacinthi DSM 19077]
MKTLYLTPLLLALSIGQALASTPINLSKDIRPNAKVSIDNVKGEVTVTAWDKNQIQVSGTLGDGARPLEIEGSDGNVEIHVDSDSKEHSMFSWGSDTRMQPTVLNVRVPKAVSVEINVVSAPVSIDGLDGGKIEINSVSGRIRGNLRSPDLNLQTVSGSIDLAGSAAKADLQTVSGDITAPTVTERVEAQTVSGRMTIGGGPWKQANFSTVSGDTQITGGPSRDGKIDVDSMSGDVQLQLPSDVSAKLEASTFSGSIRSDFGSPSSGEDGPGKQLKTTIGSGSAHIHVESFSGDVRLRGQGR